MNLGFFGLLGLLQAAVPQDTTLKDSIMVLMDSVAPAVNYQGTRTTEEIPYSQNQRKILSRCNSLSRNNKEKQTSVSVGLCRKVLEPQQNRPAILVVETTQENPNFITAVVVVDWDNDYEADVCYTGLLDAIKKEIKIQFLKPEKCQPQYYESLKKFEKYKPEFPVKKS